MSTNPLYLHFAYAELRDVALDGHASSASRRTALFSDQKFSPSLWSTLARESLLRLGHDYQAFLRRGAPAPAPAPGPTVVPKASQPPATPLLRKAIYKAQQQSPISKMLDTFASDSDLTKAADAVATEVGMRVMDAPIPELFRSTSAPPTATAPASATTPTAAVPQPDVFSAYLSRAKAQSQEWAIKHAPLWCREAVGEWNAWWHRDHTNKVAEQCLPNRDLDALIVQGGPHKASL